MSIFKEEIVKTKRIGSVQTGYVDVPDSFVKFINDEILSNGTIQYSDISTKNIITLQYVEASYMDATTSACNMYEKFINDPMVMKESIVKARVLLGGCEAYQVYCYYPLDDTYVITWSFNSPSDNFTHYVAVEFTSDNKELFNMVENSYCITD